MHEALHFFLYAAIPAEQQTTLSRHARIMAFIHQRGLVSLFDMKEEFKAPPRP